MNDLNIYDCDIILEALDEYTQEALKPLGIENIGQYDDNEGWLKNTRDAYLKINQQRQNLAKS